MAFVGAALAVSTEVYGGYKGVPCLGLGMLLIRCLDFMAGAADVSMVHGVVRRVFPPADVVPVFLALASSRHELLSLSLYSLLRSFFSSLAMIFSYLHFAANRRLLPLPVAVYLLFFGAFTATAPWSIYELKIISSFRKS